MLSIPHQATGMLSVPQPSTPAVVEDPQTHQASASLSDFLASARLKQYEHALRDLGCTEVADLAHVDEAACIEIGMKKIEIKRLLRTA